MSDQYPRLRGGAKPGDRKTYRASCYATEVGITPTGTSYVRVHFWCEAETAVATKTLWLTEKAWPKTDETLKLLGWDAEKHGFRFAQQLDTGGESPIAKAAVEVDIVVEEEKNQQTGRVWPQVAFVNEPGKGGGGGPKERMDAAAAKEFDAQLRRMLGGGPPKPGAKPPASDRAAAAGAKDPTKPHSIPMNPKPTAEETGAAAAAAAKAARDEAKNRPLPETGPDDEIDFEQIPF